MQRIITLWLCLLATTAALGQRFTPLDQHEQLQRDAAAERARLPLQRSDRVGAREAVDCDFFNTDFPVALANIKTPLSLAAVDTTGLSGPTGLYRCVNCEELLYGAASIEAGKLIYTPAPTATANYDTLRVTYCNTALNRCADTVAIVVLARRADRIIQRPFVLLDPGGVVTLQGIPSDLPGDLFCSTLETCSSTYDGRDQLLSFVDPNATADFRFVYRASRFDGVDTVCLRLCTEVGVCDTYRYAIRIQQPVRELPFFDDFSYDGPYTDPRYWLDRDVLVNATYAQQPPSVGVATFDGINYQGRPYLFGGGRTSERDRLTSVPLNLSGQRPVMTFYVQPRGLGERPEARDSLLLQFRQQNGVWRTVRSFGGLSNTEGQLSARPFQPVRLEIPENYRYRGFKFRFVNMSNETGGLDNWHVDYVRVDNIQTEFEFADIAFTEPPSQVLESYTAIPYRHLQAADPALVNDTLRIGIWNHADQPLSVQNSRLSIVELNTGLPLLNATLFSGQDANIPNGMPIERVYNYKTDAFLSGLYPAFVANLFGNPALAAAEELRIRTRYTLVNNSQITTPGLREAVLRNDTVERVTVLADYFAYDDGTAELALEALPGQTVVQKFTAYVPDVLKGISVRLPRNAAPPTKQRLGIVVYLGELDDRPDFEFEVEPVYAENFSDTLQGFTTYKLRNARGGADSLALPVGDFYIGWTQLTNCDICPAIGFDRNSAPRGVQFFTNGSGWFALPGPVRGAIMLRPLVGNSEVLATDVDEPAPADALGVLLFPNPARDRVELRFSGEVAPERLVLQLFNGMGQRVLTQTGVTAPLSVGLLPAGIYWLHLHDPASGRSAQHKLIIAR